ncbi:carboxymuconolactone decarboxylase family protein [Microbacter sp. GSS18]|nr:carboxymuconolactone decarboxylase family protein [Microbacter sp. GSS18]
MANYRELLRRLAANEPGIIDAEGPGSLRAAGLDDQSRALIRLAGLVAVGGSDASYAEQVDAAVSAGLTADAIVAVLFELGPTVGVPRTVTAASSVARGLGYDLEE